jgi:hypothetical protein
MNAKLRRLLLAVAAATAAPAATAAEPASADPAVANAPKTIALPLAPRFKTVRERIDALFAHRRETPPPPDPKHNPFRLPGALVGNPAVAAAARDSSPEASPDTDAALLRQAAATLKISGTFEVGGRSHLVINGRPYKQGDVIQTQLRGDPVYLRVRTIADRTVTLGLNTAELALKF